MKMKGGDWEMWGDWGLETKKKKYENQKGVEVEREKYDEKKTKFELELEKAIIQWWWWCVWESSIVSSVCVLYIDGQGKKSKSLRYWWVMFTHTPELHSYKHTKRVNLHLVRWCWWWW